MSDPSYPFFHSVSLPFPLDFSGVVGQPYSADSLLPPPPPTDPEYEKSDYFLPLAPLHVTPPAAHSNQRIPFDLSNYSPSLQIRPISTPPAGATPPPFSFQEGRRHPLFRPEDIVRWSGQQQQIQQEAEGSQPQPPSSGSSGQSIFANFEGSKRILVAPLHAPAAPPPTPIAPPDLEQTQTQANHDNSLKLPTFLETFDKSRPANFPNDSRMKTRRRTYDTEVNVEGSLDKVKAVDGMATRNTPHQEPESKEGEAKVGGVIQELASAPQPIKRGTKRKGRARSASNTPKSGSARAPAPKRAKKESEVVAAEKRRRWFPNDEEKKELYSHSSFVIDYNGCATAKAPLDTIMWRIYNVEDAEDKVLLQRYEPIDLNGRELHKSTTKMVLHKRDRTFYSRYVPVYCVKIFHSDRISIFQYFNIDRITPVLLKIRESQHLIPHFRRVAELIFKEIIYGSYIEKALEEEEESKRSWTIISSECNEKVKSLYTECNMPAEFIRPFCAYPVLTLGRAGDVKGSDKKKISCDACPSHKKPNKASYIANFKQQPYNPITFKPLLEASYSAAKEEGEKYICHTCRSPVHVMSRLYHYLWSLYVSIRTYVTDLVSELGPNEKLKPSETIKSLLNDYEWFIKSFVEFQVLLAEAEKEILSRKRSRKSL